MFYCSVAECGSGSRIRCFLTPGSGKEKKCGSGIRDEYPRSFIRKLRNSFFGIKILKFFDVDPGSRTFFDSGSGNPVYTSRFRNTVLLELLTKDRGLLKECMHNNLCMVSLISMTVIFSRLKDDSSSALLLPH
jgi:hypothetical protein